MQNFKLIKKIASDAFILLTKSTAVKMINLPVTFLIAKVLGPEGLATLKLIDILPSLAKYGDIGYTSVLLRKISNVVHENKVKPTLERDTSYTATIIWGGFLCLCALLVSLLNFEKEIRIGIAIAIATLFVSIISKLYITNCKLEKNFYLMSKAQVYSSLITAITTLSSLWVLNIYSPLLGALLGAITLVLFLKKKIDLNYRFRLDRKELIEQTKIAIPLALVTFVFGLEMIIERSLITYLWGLSFFGQYIFIALIFQTAIMILNSFLQSLSVHLYERLGVNPKLDEATNIVRYPTILFAYILPALSNIAIPITMVCLEIYFPKYNSSIKWIPIIYINIWISIVPSVIVTSMTSSYINKQTAALILRVLSIAVFSILAFIFWHQNKGLGSIFMAKGIGLTLIFCISFWITRNNFHNSTRKFVMHFLFISLPGVIFIASHCIIILTGGHKCHGYFTTAIVTLLISLIPILFMGRKYPVLLAIRNT